MTQTLHPTPTKHKSPWRWLWRLFTLLLCCALILLGSASYTYHTKLAPDTHSEWTYIFKYKGLSFPLSVSKTILWASSPQVAPWLDGLKKNSSHGQYQLHWDKSKQSLIVSCEQCVNRIHGLGADDFVFERIALHIHQDAAKNLSGQIIFGTPQAIHLPWTGQFKRSSFTMNITGNDLPIMAIYQTLAPELKELQSAHITGNIKLATTVELPTLTISLDELSAHDFSVSGLGTEELLTTTSQCGPAANLPMDHWLVRSVMAAEDQRFETHRGYDLDELMAAFDQNHARGSIVRGGSTITQQLAKLLYTGSDKTLERKMREILYAVEMERTLGKERIMALYLDNAPWGLASNGRLICGAQAAAQSYFDVDAIDLEPHQAVWLAAMLHAPIREITQWQERGEINLERAIWVASNVRNAPDSGPRGRQKVIDTLKHNPSLRSISADSP